MYKFLLNSNYQTGTKKSRGIMQVITSHLTRFYPTIIAAWYDRHKSR